MDSIKNKLDDRELPEIKKMVFLYNQVEKGWTITKLNDNNYKLNKKLSESNITLDNGNINRHFVKEIVPLLNKQMSKEYTNISNNIDKNTRS